MRKTTVNCTICGTILTDVNARTKYCDECRRHKQGQYVKKYNQTHREKVNAYQRMAHQRKRDLLRIPKYCIICNAELPKHYRKYCPQCNTLQKRINTKKSFRKHYKTERATERARKCREKHLNTKIETYRLKIPVLPTIDSKSVCIAMQCDPSVRYFETTVLPKLHDLWESSHPTIPFPTSEQETITQKIRDINKILYKKKLYPMAKTIIVLALWAQYGRLVSQEYVAQLGESDVVTLRTWVKRLNPYFPIELQVKHKRGHFTHKKFGKAIYGEIL